MSVVGPCLCQNLKALTPEDNAQCHYGVYFQDGQRRVDYVLTYHVKRPGGARHARNASRLLTDNPLARSLRRGTLIGARTGGQDKRPRGNRPPLERAGYPSPPPPPPPPPPPKRRRREEFEKNLLDMGLELEKDEDVSGALKTLNGSVHVALHESPGSPYGSLGL